MTSALVSAGVGVLTFISSVGVSAFISGSRWGDLGATVREINNRLAKIEGMFTLTLRDHDG